jgi:signal transduction histidine kinase
LGVLCAALLLIGVLVADRLARRVVGSVTDLATVAHRLAGNDLAARVKPHGAREVVAVGNALNRLAERIGDLLAAEREDAANLAHRLRTPVTALRLDVEAVPDETDRARLTSDVDELTRSIDEIIRTARRPVREGVQARADLSAVVADRARFWSVLAEDTGRSLSVRVHPDVVVRAAQPDLIATVDALLENVFSHTPDGTAVEVDLSATPDGSARLVVADHGPGFALQPSRGLSGAGSTGLGLDIARRTTESAGGTLRLAETAGGGATVELVLPLHA